MYSLTGDDEYVFNIVKTLSEYKEIANFTPTDAGAYIYGAGTYGLVTKRIFNDNYIGFIDSDNSLIEKDGLKVYRINEVDSNRRVYITPKFYHREIKENLIKHGFREKT